MKIAHLTAPLALLLTIGCDEANLSLDVEANADTQESMARSTTTSPFIQPTVRINHQATKAALLTSYAAKGQQVVSYVTDNALINPKQLHTIKRGQLADCIVDSPTLGDVRRIVPSCDGMQNWGYVLEIASCDIGADEKISGEILVSNSFFRQIDAAGSQWLIDIAERGSSTTGDGEWYVEYSLDSGTGTQIDGCGVLNNYNGVQEGEFDSTISSDRFDDFDIRWEGTANSRSMSDGARELDGMLELVSAPAALQQTTDVSFNGLAQSAHSALPYYGDLATNDRQYIGYHAATPENSTVYYRAGNEQGPKRTLTLPKY